MAFEVQGSGDACVRQMIRAIGSSLRDFEPDALPGFRWPVAADPVGTGASDIAFVM
jgi:hypothetical protein